MSLEQRQHPLDMRLIRPRNPGPSYVEDDDGVDEQEGTCISCNEDEMLWLSDNDEDNNDAVFVKVENPFRGILKNLEVNINILPRDF